MSIRMPTYTQLSKEQLKILEDSDFDDNLLVTGPPGTGKTVIAMWRAQQLGKAHDSAINLIMFNKVLKQYAKQWDSEDFTQRVSVATYHSWVARLWLKNGFDGPFPPSLPGSGYEYDWPAIQTKLMVAQIPIGQIVVDEAQDLPVAFYKALGLLTGNDPEHKSSFCIVADENQRLTESTNSSIADIRGGILLADPTEYELNLNYRNTREIALLAHKFYVGLQTGMAEIPENRQGPKPRMIGFRNGTTEMVESIARHAKNNPTNSVLVVCPTTRKVKSLRNKLEHRLQGRSVRAYVRDDDKHKAENLETGQDGSITLVHWRSMKGVEADAVFVPHFEENDLGGDSLDREKMLLYVLFSRARQTLEIQYDSAASENRWVKTTREMAGETLEHSSV